MKRKILLVMVILITLLLGACGSQPTPPPPPPPAASTPAPPPPPPPPPPPADVTRHHTGIIIEGAASYTVKAGDTLSAIGYRVYDDGSLYPLIMMVSDDHVTDPDEIEPDMVLTVPDVSRNFSDARAKAAIDVFFTGIAAIEDQRGRHKTAELIREHTK